MFETERLLMNVFQKSDFEDVKKLFINPLVRKYLGGIREEQAIGTLMEEMLCQLDDAFYWTVREKSEGGFIGLVSLDRHHEGEIEVSYQFLPQWWGKGYAGEAVQFIMHYAFKELKLPKIIAETQMANTPSRRLLERIGMKLENTVLRFGSEQGIYSMESGELNESM